MFVGWDWASTTHDVTVLNDAGAVVDRWALRHTEQDLVAALDRLARLAEPAALPVSSSAPVGWSWSACWLPVTQWCRCTPPRSGPPVRAGARRERSPILATATSLLTTCVPMGTGCAGWTHPTWASKSCRLWCGCVRTTCGPDRGQQPARRPAGGALARPQSGVLPAGVADRARLPDRLPDPSGRCPARPGAHGQLLPPPQLPRRQDPG